MPTGVVLSAPMLAKLSTWPPVPSKVGAASPIMRCAMRLGLGLDFRVRVRLQG